MNSTEKHPRFTFEPVNEAYARQVLGWRYEAPYDFYNIEPERHQQVLSGSYLNPEYRYHAVFDQQGDFIAFRCFGEDARVPGGDYSREALDMGGGLRPDLTGQGLGALVIQAAMEFAREKFHPKAFRTTVAEFNLRAQKACAKGGYEFFQRFINSETGVPYIILMKIVENG